MSASVRDEAFEETAMVVHLAVMLVQWSASGVVRRLPTVWSAWPGGAWGF
jgi:hypothetical protein